MTFAFYQCNDDPIKLVKSPQNRIAVEGVLKNSTDLLNPILEVTPFTGYESYNYLYLETTQRFYFLNLPIIQLGGILEYHANVDPLYSWYRQIQELSGITDRAPNNNIFLPDSHLKQQSNLNIIQHNFTGSELLSSVSQSNISIVLNVLGV